MKGLCFCYHFTLDLRAVGPLPKLFCLLSTLASLSIAISGCQNLANTANERVHYAGGSLILFGGGGCGEEIIKIEMRQKWSSRVLLLLLFDFIFLSLMCIDNLWRGRRSLRRKRIVVAQEAERNR